MIIYLVTRNPTKIAAAQSVFEGTNIIVKGVDKEYPEIQANSSLEIAKESALQAAADMNGPAIREDHSLFINALSGFPGPYTNYFEKTMPAKEILNLVAHTKDRTGYFEIAAVIGYPDGTHKDFVYRVPIKISTVEKGTQGNWDKILMLEESDETFSESPSSNRIHVWNKNFKKIKEHLDREN